MKKKYYIPKSILSETKKFLMEKGKKQEEGYALWKGKQIGEGEYGVTGILIPNQIATRSIFGYSFDIPTTAIEEINIELFKSGEMGLIQVHSHPGISTVHSDRDDRLSLLSRRGALSIVVPHFGNMPFEDFSHATVHINIGVYQWKAISRTEIEETIFVVGDAV